MDPILEMRDDFVPRGNRRFDVFIHCQRQSHGDFVEVDLKLKVVSRKSFVQQGLNAVDHVCMIKNFVEPSGNARSV